MDNTVYFKLFVALLALSKYMIVSESTLVSNASVACPGQIVSFTCNLPGSFIQWRVEPPPGSSLNPVQSGILSANELDQTFTFGNTGFMFQYVLIDASGGNLTATLTTITEVSSLRGSMVTCISQSQEGPLTIQVANPPPPLLNVSLGFQNGTSTSVVTLQWAPPTSTGGVNVSYVLTVSPPPVSWSTITTQTSTDITVSYNIQYNVTIRTESCAGSSNGAIVFFELVACPSPSVADGVVLNNVPSVTTEGSTLTFTCTGTSDMVTSTCGSDGMWSPDPADYVCLVPTVLTTAAPAPPIMCGPPKPPSNGSVSVGNQSSLYVQGTTVTFECDDGLFPGDTMTATCRDMSGSGEWNPNPADLICRMKPVNCSVPDEPVNGTILDYDNIVTIEGSVITFQCNPGFSPEGEMAATCTNAGLWNPDPAGVACRKMKVNQLTELSREASIAVTFTLTFITTLTLGIIIGVVSVLLYNKCRRGASQSSSQPPTELKQVGPLYEEPEDFKPDPETAGNVAYGHVQPRHSRR